MQLVSYSEKQSTWPNMTEGLQSKSARTICYEAEY